MHISEFWSNAKFNFSPSIKLFRINIYFSSCYIYIRQPRSTLASDYFLRPFNYNIWMAVIFSIVIGNIFVIIFHLFKEKSEERSFTDNIFLIFESFCNQTGNDKMENIFLRIISLESRMIAIILMATFSAVITSFLTLEIPEIPFHNFQQFVRNGQFKLILSKRSPFYLYFITVRKKKMDCTRASGK